MKFHEPVICPGCHRALTASECITYPGAVPRPGNLTLCARCGEVMAFEGPPLAARSATEAERKLLAETDPKCAFLAEALRERWSERVN